MFVYLITQYYYKMFKLKFNSRLDTKYNRNILDFVQDNIVHLY